MHEVVRLNGANFKTIAGPTLSASLDMNNSTIFVAMGPFHGSSRKFTFLCEFNSMKFYKHCKVEGEILAFRPVIPRVCSVTARQSANDTVQVTVRGAINGDVILQHDFYCKASIGDVKIKVMQVLMANEPYHGISNNTPLPFIAGDKVLSQRTQLINLLNELEEKSLLKVL